MLISVQTTPLDLAELVNAVSHDAAGAVVTFAGVVRDHHEGKRVTGIRYDAYGDMAEAMMRRIARDVEDRWPDCRVAIVHRTGKLEIGEASVLIAVSAPHRGEAFDACEYAIDTLKQIVPIWKKEAYEDGEVWLEHEHRLAQEQAKERQGGMTTLDTLRRPLHDLRISVTDRCNFRCVYCMPKEVFGKDFQFLPPKALLSFEEITRLTRVFVSLGVEKVRLTGGEPLLRREIEKLIAMLAELPGLKDLTLTTNASALALKAQALHDAGLRRITVSLDSLDEAVFRAMNDVDFPVARVLEGIEAARAAGLAPIKVNMVVKRGLNEHEILPMAHHFHGTGVILRFIEFMDVGSTNGWRMDDVVSAREIVDTISRELPLEPAGSNYSGEVAARYRYLDGGGEIGVISSVTQPFCATCSRARLTSEGQLYTCLFGNRGTDLRSLLRSGATDEELTNAVRGVWLARTDRYSELRTIETVRRPKVEMSHIGG